MDLSVIIVNYRTPTLTRDCLRSLRAETRGLQYEVIVVDNASGDDSRDQITGEFPDVRWIQMGYNAGFARANNMGIRESCGSAVLLLNSDTLIEDGAVEGCFRELAAGPYVAAGVQLLNPDRSSQISGNFFMRGGLNYLLPLPYLGQLVKWLGRRFNVARPHIPNASATQEADWINGAFLMVKREAIDRAGLMDEDFFLYAEEAEWCGRLRKIGPLCIYGQFHVVHFQGASANDMFGSEGKGYYNLYDRKGLQIMLSNFVRIRKQFGKGWFLFQLFFYIVEIPVFLAGLPISALTGRPRYSWTRFRQYCMNVGVIISKSPVILRNKPHFYKVI
ncbi:MAG TPA: glycosyltransferase family 2 protein [Puia sp.]|nr:glycosyltransferase family 2 protein [Puia sp.]